MIGSREFAALGTTATVLTTDAGCVDEAAEAVSTTVTAVDAAASRFRSDSELMNLSPGRRQRVGPLLAAVFEKALVAARSTGGAVDPTIGADLIALGYDRDYAALGEGALPRERSAQSPSLGVDWRLVTFDRELRTVRVPEGVVVDFGATGKALAADLAAIRAAAATGCGVLVNLGGDLAVAGEAPADGWPVGVADSHRADPETVPQTIAVRTGGLATSSVTVRTWQRHGETMHHIIDPATRRPAAIVWRTVSVAAPTCAGANTISTACLVRGNAALHLLASQRLPARLVAADGRVVTVGGWPQEEAAV